MQQKNIWGKVCDCGNEVFDYFDENFYVMPKDYEKIMICPKCKTTNKISTNDAENFYKSKIFECFEGVYGNVLELGCGDGILTKYLATLQKVERITSVDLCNTLKLKSEKVKFKQLDLNQIEKFTPNISYDFVVCKDILMYLDDIEKLFFYLSKYSVNLLLLNWFNFEHKNCINKATPTKIVNIIKKYYKVVDLEYPHFYKWGYLIKAEK